jgi:hypothetical protein
VIVRAQLDESGVEQNLIAAAFEDGTFQVVVKNYSRLPAPKFKSVDVAAQGAAAVASSCPASVFHRRDAGSTVPRGAHRWRTVPWRHPTSGITAQNESMIRNRGCYSPAPRTSNRRKSTPQSHETGSRNIAADLRRAEAKSCGFRCS